MNKNIDIIIHIISIFLVIFFSIVFSLFIIIKPNVNIFLKLFTFVILIISINLTFNIINSNMLYYNKFICNNFKFTNKYNYGNKYNCGNDIEPFDKEYIYFKNI